MTIRARIDGIARNKMLRSIGVLVGGTAFAHVITALTLPIVTRLYTPADFSGLALFAGLLAILSVAATLRFDLAIAIPEQDSEAVNLLALAIVCTSIVAALVATVVIGLPANVVDSLNQPKLVPLLWLLPVGVLLAGCYSALQMWFVRQRAFEPIARSRVTQSAASAATQIGLGWLHWTPGGLILGQLLNTGAGCISLGYRLLLRHHALIRQISWSGLRDAFAKYDRFPKYSTFEALSNTAAMQLPIIMISSHAASSEAGFLLLAMSAMQAPMGLIGNAIAQVYLSRAPEELRNGNLNNFTSTVFGGLLRSGVGPLMFAGIVAPTLFSVVFGVEWRRAGILVSWMTPWFIMQYLSVPISMALHVTGSQKVALILQIFGMCLRVGVVYVVSINDPTHISEAYAISGLIFYAIYLATVLKIVRSSIEDVIHELYRGIVPVLPWVVSGGLIIAFDHLQNIFGS